MELEKAILELRRMRFLENEGDNIEEFEEILNDLSIKATNDVIPLLCTIFEDTVAEPSANDYIIETIFYIAKRNGVEDGISKLIYATPQMLPQAGFWAERIYRTLLNSNDLFESLLRATKKNDIRIIPVVRGIFETLKEEEPELFLEKVILVLDKSNI